MASTVDEYASAKTIAKGFLDVALLTTNAKIVFTLFLSPNTKAAWVKWLILGLVIPNIGLNVVIGMLLFALWCTKLRVQPPPAAAGVAAGGVPAPSELATVVDENACCGCNVVRLNKAVVGLTIFSVLLSIFIEVLDALRQSK